MQEDSWYMHTLLSMSSQKNKKQQEVLEVKLKKEFEKVL